MGKEHRITTGPFFIPPNIDGGFTPDNMLINLVNPTNKRLTVNVFLARAPQAIFPATAPLVNSLTQTVTLDPRRSTTVNATLGVNYQIRDTVRVTFVRDIEEEGEKIEASVVVGDGGRTDATTFFRHDDLFETDNVI